MNIGFYSGSFDPFTNGHLYVVKQSSKLFDKVIVGLGVNSLKSRKYNVDIMRRAIDMTLAHQNIYNVETVVYDCLSVDVALTYHANFLIRGLRNGMDYHYEENIAAINEELAHIPTIYIRAGCLGTISSSMVLELLKYGKDVSKFVPEDIYNVITT